MKLLFLIFVCFLVKGTAVYAQCPQPGLKIQSALCDSAHELIIDTFTCSYLKIKWQGRQSQSYKIEAVSTEQTTGKESNLEASKYFCDGSGNCSATIPVRSGAVVNWSIQSICTQDGNSLYGYKQMGQQVKIFGCPNIKPNSPSLHAYPNPTSGILNVDYSGGVSSETIISVLDLSGKPVLSLSGGGVAKTSTGFLLNMQGKVSGAYLLKVTNGKEQSQAKFMLITSR